MAGGGLRDIGKTPHYLQKVPGAVTEIEIIEIGRVSTQCCRGECTGARERLVFSIYIISLPLLFRKC